MTQVVRVPAYQIWGPEFKALNHQGKKKKGKQLNWVLLCNPLIWITETSKIHLTTKVESDV
jgi:hypothetical protein